MLPALICLVSGLPDCLLSVCLSACLRVCVCVWIDGISLGHRRQQQVVTESLLCERISGMVAWGQWRGWYAPQWDAMTGTGPIAADVSADGPTRLGGTMGNGVMMNTQLLCV